MLRGIGDTQVTTLDLGTSAADQVMQELCLFEFSFASEVATLTAECYQKGIRKTKATAEGTVTDTLTLRLQYNDWASLGFTLDAFPKTEASVNIPILKFGTVPTSAPYEITDADITTAGDDNVKSYVSEVGTWGQPGSLTKAASAGTAGPREADVQVGKIVYNAAQAGAPITYTVLKEYTSIQAYGGPGDQTKYGDLAFRGQVYSTEQTDPWPIYFPQIQRNGRPSLAFAGDVPILEIPFLAITPSGWDVPYQILNPDTAA